MRLLKLNFLFLGAIFSLATLTSCDDDDDVTVLPITLGSKVNVNNTFQSPAFGYDDEMDFAVISGMNAGDFAADATLSSSVEFPAYIGLYDINISETTITFDVIAPEDDPTFSGFWRIIEAGTFDRYYLTFENAQNVKGFTSSNPNVRLRIDSEKVLVVEISQGYDFNPDQKFTITLN
ncbi:hypothetical protein [Flammeovirga sp. SJP92]|uniref:hypothetical protein n=1 Tax=Flammeovirga sp. SJP92 TaxID=1775430 RepID=UPI0007876E02|nr:hypothetical protein [Flammeovirga sp. SJP92]KXX70791.1 hypothetical protein AVL50_07065 [Flammeovirga sp. SJP92]